MRGNKNISKKGKPYKGLIINQIIQHIFDIDLYSISFNINRQNISKICSFLYQLYHCRYNDITYLNLYYV